MNRFETLDQDRAFEKLDALKDVLARYSRVLVAFSGGVDSTFLLAVAHEVLGSEAMAITAQSVFSISGEVDAAARFCIDHGIDQSIEMVDVLSHDAIRENASDRCYHCKHVLFERFIDHAHAIGAVLVDGTNEDDTRDYRPGMRALDELDVQSPLLQMGLSKDEIRFLANRMGLAIWDDPACACLASRIPYGTELDADTLRKVDAAEAFLKALGFKQCRVRVHGNLARIEIPREEFDRFRDDETAARVVNRLKSIGFDYAALDLLGYRMGSFNEVLERSSQPAVDVRESEE